MKNFLHKFVYITINKNGNLLYYTCAYVTEVSNTHISFTDRLHNDEPFLYRIEQIEDCKLSNKVDSDGKLIKKEVEYDKN